MNHESSQDRLPAGKPARSRNKCLLAVLVLAVSAAEGFGVELGSPIPRVWPGAALNLVVLPYGYTGPTERGLDDTAEQLTRLVIDHMLFRLVKYESIGITSLSKSAMTRLQHSLPKAVNSVPEEVMAQLLGQKPADEQLSKGKALVLMWGLLYVEGDDVYVQSYMWFVRRDVIEDAALKITTAPGTSPVLIGALPNQPIAFAPQKLSQADLARIRGAFEQSARIYDDANGKSRSRSFLQGSEDRLRFIVTDSRNGWMKVQALESDLNGWIRPDTNLGEQTLNEKMPELDFGDAAAGYLAYRMASDNAARGGGLTQAAWAQAALSEYQSKVRHSPRTTATAMANMLEGMLLLLTGGEAPSGEMVELAHAAFGRAVEILPHSPEAHNLHNLTRIYLGHRSAWKSENPLALSRAVRRSLALDPKNDRTLANLQRLYELMGQMRPSESGISSEKLRTYVNAVRDVREKLETRAP